MNKPVPASPAQISDEPKVSPEIQHYRDSPKGPFSPITAKPRAVDEYEAGFMRCRELAERIVDEHDGYLERIGDLDPARSRLEPVEAPKEPNGPIGQHWTEFIKELEPVEGVSTTPKCANCDHDLHDGERCRTAITVLPMKQCPCMRSMLKVSTPLPQQEAKG